MRAALEASMRRSRSAAPQRRDADAIAAEIIRRRQQEEAQPAAPAAEGVVIVCCQFTHPVAHDRVAALLCNDVTAMNILQATAGRVRQPATPSSRWWQGCAAPQFPAQPILHLCRSSASWYLAEHQMELCCCPASDRLVIELLPCTAGERLTEATEFARLVGQRDEGTAAGADDDAGGHMGVDAPEGAPAVGSKRCGPFPLQRSCTTL